MFLFRTRRLQRVGDWSLQQNRRDHQVRSATASRVLEAALLHCVVLTGLREGVSHCTAGPAGIIIRCNLRQEQGVEQAKECVPIASLVVLARSEGNHLAWAYINALVNRIGRRVCAQCCGV